MSSHCFQMILLVIIVHLVYRTLCMRNHVYNSPLTSLPETLIETISQQYKNVKISQNIATESVTLSTRIIQTKYGSIRGNVVKLSTTSNEPRPYSTKVSSLNLSDVETYLGVPYATPPTGGLRFMPPVTPTHWRGVRLVNRLRPVCPQHIPARDYQAIRSRNESEALRWMPRARYEYLRRLIPMLGNQSEDCLYLNIYVPIATSSNRSGWSSNEQSGTLPVLVLLHGESYDWHSGNVFDGSVLASYGQVVVVTVNFRLGILGFLPAFADGTIRGNYGLMDQVAALHWIQENIGEFGGSASNVTLIGHGHGAACAHLLMLSPMAKGLFNRVILMSGSALSPWALARDPEHYALSLGQKLNCTNLETMIDCLRTRKIGQLIAQYEDWSPEHLTAFGPIIDSIVVPFDPVHLYRTELYHSSSPSTYDDVRTRIKEQHNQTSITHLTHTGNIYHHSVSTSGFDPLSLARSYDLVVGITDADSPCLFSDQESVYGMEPDRRDRILRTLVRNLYDYHQQAIFLILYNEYSTWSASPYSPNTKRSFDILDSATSILSDALVFAPLVKSVDLHSKPFVGSTSQSFGRVFFYRFDTNQVSQESLYREDRYSTFQDQLLSPSKRIICSVGHDLAFLFGDPIAHLNLGLNSQVGPFYYPVNLTRTHQIVSELFIQYIVNFARYGEPNTRSSHFETTSNPLRQTTKNTQRHFWPQYDQNQKNYLMLGTTGPKSLDHRQNHRLSLWLNLIPRLLIDDHEFFQTNFGTNLSNVKKNQHKKFYSKNYYNYGSNNIVLSTSNGSERSGLAETSKHIAGIMVMDSEPYSSQQQQKQLYRQHHLLVDYDNPKTYDGVVRNFSNDTNRNINTMDQTTESLNLNSSTMNQSIVNTNLSLLTTTIWHMANVTHNPMNASENLDAVSSQVLQSRYDSITNLNHHYIFNGSTWWLIMIGAACSILFFINVIFFIALFYQLKKNRKFNLEQKMVQKDKTPEIRSIQSTIPKESVVVDQLPTTMLTKNKYEQMQFHNMMDQQDDLMILHSRNTINKKNNLSPSSEMYQTPNDPRVHQPINFELANHDRVNRFTEGKTIPLGNNKQSSNDQDFMDSHHQSHTILLNDPNSTLNNNNVPTNYVPFLTSNPSQIGAPTSQQTTYYCLQVNPHTNTTNFKLIDGANGGQRYDSITIN